MRTAQRIYHGHSGGSFQAGILRQIHVVHCLRRQALSLRDADQSPDRRGGHIHESEVLQPNGTGRAPSKCIVPRGRFLQRLVVCRIQDTAVRIHIGISGCMHRKTASVLIGDRAVSQRILRSHCMTAATGMCRPDFASSISACLLVGTEIIRGNLPALNTEFALRKSFTAEGATLKTNRVYKL